MKQIPGRSSLWHLGYKDGVRDGALISATVCLLIFTLIMLVWSVKI